MSKAVFGKQCGIIGNDADVRSMSMASSLFNPTGGKRRKLYVGKNKANLFSDLLDLCEHHNEYTKPVMTKYKDDANPGRWHITPMATI